MVKKKMKQPALVKNKTRNERRNKRVGQFTDLIRNARDTAKCEVCGVTNPLVFYGKHHDLLFSKVLEGRKSLKTMRRNFENKPILCLNHAVLKRESDENRNSKYSRTQHP